MKYLKMIAPLNFVFFLAACGDDTRAEIVNKGRDAGTRAELQALLGDPDKISKVGPIETWTFNASDGSVSYLLTGDIVTTSRTSDERAE